jgi:hypothetical protein
MDTRDLTNRDQSVEERAETLSRELNLPDDAAQSAARDRSSPQPTRKPASEDVELERIAAAQTQNAGEGKH